jgi:fatty acid-binding protein DegV
MNPLAWKIGALMIDAVLAGVEKKFVIDEVRVLEEQGKSEDEITTWLRETALKAVADANKMGG